MLGDSQPDEVFEPRKDLQSQIKFGIERGTSVQEIDCSINIPKEWLSLQAHTLSTAGAYHFSNSRPTKEHSRYKCPRDSDSGSIGTITTLPVLEDTKYMRIRISEDSVGTSQVRDKFSFDGNPRRSLAQNR